MAAHLVAVLAILATTTRVPLSVDPTSSPAAGQESLRIDAVEQQLKHALHVEQNAVRDDQSRISGDRDKIKAVENEEAQSQAQLDERVGCWDVKALGGTKTPLAPRGSVAGRAPTWATQHDSGD